MFKIISKKKLEELELNALNVGLSRDMVFRVEDFMRRCGQNTTSHDPEQVSLYIGLMAEELAEVLECLPESMKFYEYIIWSLGNLSELGKQGKLAEGVRAANQEQLLDGFIDSAIVSLGAAISASPQAYLATRKVLNANDAKTTGGRDENGKIQKPEGWQPPDLNDFIYREDR